MSEKLKHDFLKKLVTEVEYRGWSNQLLDDVCLELGLDEKYWYIWFQNGTIDVLDHLESSYDQEMLEILKQAPDETGITQKIAAALQIRMCQTSRSQILAIKNSQFYLHPSNTCDAIKFAWRTVDLIWQYAGDNSTDFNYYSKRSLLHGVYLSSQTYYNLDNSDNNIKTKKFIDESLRAIVDTTKCVKKIPKLLKKIPFLRMFI